MESCVNRVVVEISSFCAMDLLVVKSMQSWLKGEGSYSYTRQKRRRFVFFPPTMQSNIQGEPTGIE